MTCKPSKKWPRRPRIQDVAECGAGGVDKYVWSATAAVQVGRRERLHIQDGKGVVTIDITID